MSDKYTITETFPNGSRIISVNTPKGPHPIQVNHRSQVPVVKQDEEGNEYTVFERLSWDDTCEQVAEQVIANVAAAANED